MKKLSFLVSAGICSLFTITSCVKEVDLQSLELPNYDGTWNVPLITTSMKFEDLVNYADEDIPVEYEYDADSDTYTIIYYDTLSGEVPEDYYALGDTVVSGTIEAEIDNIPTEMQPYFSSGADIPIPAGLMTSLGYDSIVIDTNFYVALLNDLPTDNEGDKITDANLEYITFRDGTMKIDFESDFDHRVVMNAYFESIVSTDDTSEHFSFQIEMGPTSPTATTTPPYTKSVTLDLTGYTFLLYDDENDDYNSFEVDIQTIIYPYDNRTISENDDITFDIALTDMKYDLIVGQLGTFELLNYTGEVAFSVFDNGFEDFEVKIAEPSINVDIGNTSGIPFSVLVNDLIFVNSNGQEDKLVVNIDEVEVDEVEFIADRGDTLLTSPALTINTTNTPGLEDIINTAPDQLNYDVGIQVSGNNQESYWLAYDSKVYAKTEGRLPLDFSVKNYTYLDTLDTDELGLPSIDEILVENESTGEVDTVVAWAELKIITHNSLPFDINAQLYFVDSNGVRIDSLINDPDETNLIWSSSVVDDNGYLETVSSESNVIRMTAAEFVSLVNSTEVQIEGILNTAENGEKFVKILGDYGFELSLGARFQANYPLNSSNSDEE